MHRDYYFNCIVPEDSIMYLCVSLLIVCFFQSVSVGEGLDDDIWHTIKLIRRARHMQLKVDNRSASRGKR